jgi:hypothetical protein
VKRLISCLLLGSLAGAGCFSFPKGVHPWRPNPPQPAEQVKPPAPKPPPQPVKAEEINEQNCQEKLRQLDAEVRHDEKQ